MHSGEGPGIGRFAIRVDSSRTIGTGHLVRCLTLADALVEEGGQVVFICREHPGSLSGLVRSRGHPILELPVNDSWDAVDPFPLHAAWVGANWQCDADQVLNRLRQEAFVPDWMVVDHYGLDDRWERRVRGGTGARILVIDDLLDRQHDCDLLLNQNFLTEEQEFAAAEIAQRSTVLLGPSYALLQPHYAKLRHAARIRSGAISRILVYFGGGDVGGLTLAAVEAVLACGRRDVTVDVVAPDDAVANLNRLSEQGHAINVHRHVESLAPLMMEADLAIGAVGATTWERLCMGLPSIVVCVADNQLHNARELHRRQLVNSIGYMRDVMVDMVRRAIEPLLENGLDAAWSKRCFEEVDGGGTTRVLRALVTAAGKPMPAEMVQS